MLRAVSETGFDLHFSVFGIPVRVHPLHWLTALYIAWTPSEPIMTLVKVLCVVVSILIHELGHALCLRYFHYPSEIVLHGFGGYATSTRLSTWRSVLVSFAGPFAQIVFWSFLLIIWIVALANRLQWADSTIGDDLMLFLTFTNVGWAILNLMPILPLDGGRIVEAIVNGYLPRFAPVLTLRTSILAAALLAYAACQIDDRWLLFMFIYLCFTNMLEHNEYDRSRG
jgi:stage IV sporulation protein FB